MRVLSRRVVLLALGVAVVVAGCKVETTVHVNVREDGSGVVRVVVRADAEAVKAAESGGVPIDDAVRLTDVAAGGFRVGTWERADDGSATIVISRRFRSVSEVEAIVRALNGADGPLPRLRATRERGIVATDYGVRGRIDLDAVTTGVADDAELLARLEEQGVDVGAIDEQLLAQIRSSFSLRVVVRLPDEAPVTFTPEEGATTAGVDATAQILDVERIVLLGAALGFLLLGVLLWIRGGRRRRRRRRAPARTQASSAGPARGRGTGRPPTPGRQPHPRAQPPPRRPPPGSRG